jgi:hypothetical protein
LCWGRGCGAGIEVGCVGSSKHIEEDTSIDLLLCFSRFLFDGDEVVVVCSRFDTAGPPLLLLLSLRAAGLFFQPSFAPCTRALVFTTASATVLFVVRPSLPPFFLLFFQPAQAAQVRLSLTPSSSPILTLSPRFAGDLPPSLAPPSLSSSSSSLRLVRLPFPLPDDALPHRPPLPSHPHLLLHLARKPSRPFHPRPSKLTQPPPSLDAPRHRPLCFEEQGAIQGGRRGRRSRRQTPLFNDSSR